MSDQPPASRRAIVLTQVADARALAAACALRGLTATCVGSPVGAWAAVPAPGEPSARDLSLAVPGVPVVLLEATLADGADGGPSGQTSAAVWQDGAQVRQVPAALVLSGAPAEVEGVLLGTVDVQAVAGAVESGSLSRWKAARLLASVARRGREAR